MGLLGLFVLMTKKESSCEVNTWSYFAHNLNRLKTEPRSEIASLFLPIPGLEAVHRWLRKNVFAALICG